MTDTEMRKLSRAELIGLVLEERQKAAELAVKNRELTEALNERRLQYQEAGTMAEAAMKMVGICEAADEAAKIYKENIEADLEEAKKILDDSREEGYNIVRQASAQAETLVADAKMRAEQLLADTQNQSGNMLAEAKSQAEDIIAEAENKAAAIIRDARSKAEE